MMGFGSVVLLLMVVQISSASPIVFFEKANQESWKTETAVGGEFVGPEEEHLERENAVSEELEVTGGRTGAKLSWEETVGGEFVGPEEAGLEHLERENAVSVELEGREITGGRTGAELSWEETIEEPTDVSLLEPLGVRHGGVTAYVSIEERGSSEVVFLQSLDEAELLSSPGPFNIIRVVDFLSKTVQNQVVDSYYGVTACSGSCGRDGVMDTMSCLGCIALSKAYLKPFPVAHQSVS